MVIRIKLLVFLAAFFTFGRVVAAPEAIVPAETFFQRPMFTMPQISPDGRHIAALVRFDPRHYALALIDLDTRQSDVLIKQPGQSVTDFGWKNDDLILVSVANDKGGETLQSINPRTHKSNTLDSLNTYAGRIASYLFADPSAVICPWSDGSLRRVDVRTGKSTPIERTVLGIDRWIIDPDGLVWAGIGYLGEKWIFIWRSAPGAPWQRRENPKAGWPAIDPLAVLPDRHQLVVIERMPGQTTRLASFDLTTGSTEGISQDPHVDVTGARMWGHRWEPAGARYTPDRERLFLFLPEAKKCYQMLADALPDSDCHVTSFSRDDQRAVVQAESDREMGTYYLLDRPSKQLSVIGSALPALPPRLLASSQVVEFKARDGLPLTSRITLPTRIERPPLLVRTSPNLGGPGPDNTYDDVAQFLASRGFASVCIATRGTSGFGPEFLRAGDLKITTTVIDDLEDGVAALVGRGLVDGARVGILGVGPGGITALHAALRGRFKVLVNLNTPMTVQKWNLARLAPSHRDNAELTQMIGGSGAALAYVNSLDPLAAAAQLHIPSFHNYPRGPDSLEITESGSLLRSALKKSPTPHVFHLEPLEKPDTDEARATGARFEAMAAFLRQYL